VIELVADNEKGEWLNICYPGLNATIYCSYFSMNPAMFVDISEDNRKLVYRHALKANAVTEISFSNSADKVYGVFYNLEGNVATPVQFTLTDSTKNFFRASLLFNNIPNQDSITPTLNFIKEDIKQLMESFRWPI